MKGTLVYYPKMTVTITLTDDDTPNQFFSNKSSDETYVKSLVSNPDIADRYLTADLPILEYQGGLCDPGGNYDYVIITTTKIV